MALHRRLVDYHVHSTESCDGRSSIFEFCQKATNLGMAEIGFSEHVDFDPSDRGFGFFNYNRYTSEITRASKLFEGRLIIRKGVEIDYQNRFEDETKNWLQDKQFDFTIGSVHYVNGKIIDDQLVAKSDLQILYPSYFDEVAKSIESRLFDVVGHLDYIAKHGNSIDLEKRFLGYESEILAILEKIIEKRMYLEINSNLFTLSRAETIPNKTVIAEYINKGGKLISVGSDAHSTTELCCGIAETLGFLDSYNEDRIKVLFTT